MDDFERYLLKMASKQHIYQLYKKEKLLEYTQKIKKETTNKRMA